MSKQIDIDSRIARIEQRVDECIGAEESVWTLLDLLALLWANRRSLVMVFFVTVSVSLFIAISIPSKYKAEALLAPASEGKSGGLAALAGQFGGLASMAGINLANSSIDQVTIALEILKSREFLSSFIDKYDLLVPVMAADGWDISTNSLSFDPDIFDIESKIWTRVVKPPRGTTPTYTEAYEYFVKNILSVTRDKETGLVRVGVTFYSPEISKVWTENLIREVNFEVKSRDVAEATNSIKFLQKEIVKTQISEMKNILYRLIEEQTKVLMMAEIRDEYAFKVIDKPVVPESKISPNRVIIVFFGAVFGLLLAVLVVYIQFAVKQKNVIFSNGK